VTYIKEAAAGIDDATVLRVATDEERILITEDKDFGEMVVRLGLPAHGILLLRMNPADSAAKLLRLREVIQSHGGQFAGSLVVADETRVHFRPLRTT
jgi:predicted nuclease of predicted toxin-antitoxin system